MRDTLTPTLVHYENLVKVAEKPGGAEAGWIAQDSEGRRWLYKELTPQKIRAELFGNRVFRALGYPQPEICEVVRDGVPVGVAIEFWEDLVEVGLFDEHEYEVICVINALLAEPDEDNLFVHRGQLTKLDHADCEMPDYWTGAAAFTGLPPYEDHLDFTRSRLEIMSDEGRAILKKRLTLSNSFGNDYLGEGVGRFMKKLGELYEIHSTG